MATLAQNINNTISYLDDIRDAIINTGVGMPLATPVSEYADWISKLTSQTILEVSRDSYRFSSNGGRLTIDVTCNSNWTITTQGDTTLFTVTPMSGSNDGTFTITAPMATLNREANLTIIVTSQNVSKTILITQEKSTYGKLQIQFNVITDHWPVTGNQYRISGTVILKDAFDPSGKQYIRNIDFTNTKLYTEQIENISLGTYNIETSLSVEADGSYITTTVNIEPKQITIISNQTSNVTITID